MGAGPGSRSRTGVPGPEAVLRLSPPCRRPFPARDSAPHPMHYVDRHQSPTCRVWLRAEGRRKRFDCHRKPGTQRAHADSTIRGISPATHVTHIEVAVRANARWLGDHIPVLVDHVYLVCLAVRAAVVETGARERHRRVVSGHCAQVETAPRPGAIGIRRLSASSTIHSADAPGPA